MRAALRALAIAVVALVAGRYLLHHGEEFRQLLSAGPGGWLPIIVLQVAFVWVSGRVTQRLVREFGIGLGANESFGLSALHSLGNYLPFPQGGTLARGVYLKKVRGLDYTSFAATVLVAYVEFAAIVGLLGLAVLAAWAARGAAPPWPLVSVFALLAASGIALSELPWRLPLLRRWRRLVGGLDLLRGRRVLVDLLGLQLLQLAVAATGIDLAFRALGAPVGWDASLMLALVAVASTVVTLTPANLGVTEAVAWLTARGIGLDADTTVVAFTLCRLAAFVPIFGLGPVYLLHFTRASARAGAG